MRRAAVGLTIALLCVLFPGGRVTTAQVPLLIIASPLSGDTALSLQRGLRDTGILAEVLVPPSELFEPRVSQNVQLGRPTIVIASQDAAISLSRSAGLQLLGVASTAHDLLTLHTVTLGAIRAPGNRLASAAYGTIAGKRVALPANDEAAKPGLHLFNAIGIGCEFMPQDRIVRCERIPSQDLPHWLLGGSSTDPRDAFILEGPFCSRLAVLVAQARPNVFALAGLADEVSSKMSSTSGRAYLRTLVSEDDCYGQQPPGRPAIQTVARPFAHLIFGRGLSDEVIARAARSAAAILLSSGVQSGRDTETIIAEIYGKQIPFHPAAQRPFLQALRR